MATMARTILNGSVIGRNVTMSAMTMAAIQL